MNYKFNEGDRVRITKIDDLDFYCMATYEVGDVGTISTCYETDGRNAYCIEFDRRPCHGGSWAALIVWKNYQFKVGDRVRVLAQLSIKAEHKIKVK